MKSYFLKYKKDTEKINPRISNTSNGKIMILSKCAICGCKKLRFIKILEAKGLLSNIVCPAIRHSQLLLCKLLLLHLYSLHLFWHHQCWWYWRKFLRLLCVAFYEYGLLDGSSALCYTAVIICHVETGFPEIDIHISNGNETQVSDIESNFTNFGRLETQRKKSKWRRRERKHRTQKYLNLITLNNFHVQICKAGIWRKDKTEIIL